MFNNELLHESNRYADERIPVSFVAEQRLLGIWLINPHRIDETIDRIALESFEWPVHRTIAGMLVEAHRAGRPYNLLTLTGVLDANFFRDERHKREYLAEMVATTIDTSEGNAIEYALIVRESWNKRRINAVIAGAGTEIEKASAIAELNREIAKTENKILVPLSGAIMNAMERMDATYKRGGGIAGLATGLTELDNILCGLEGGGLYVLAGRPSMGKTAAALTMGLNIAQQGKKVLFFSLEMSAEQLAYRINARYAGVSIYAQKVRPKPEDFLAVLEAKKVLANVHFDIVDCSGLSAQQIVAKSFQSAHARRYDLIIIDHLGIVAARDSRTPRVYQIGEMTAAFKALATDLKCPVLLLHQLNRGVEQRDDKRPTLADLRDSGSVEQDADAVMLLYRNEYYLSRDAEKRENESDERFEARKALLNERRRACAGRAEIIVAKNRQGRDGVVELRFDAQRQVFENLEVTP